MAGTVESEIRVAIRSDADIITARQQGRAWPPKTGFSGSDLTILATAISEVARNIVEYAGQGEITFRFVQQGSKCGIVVTARDEGPAFAISRRQCRTDIRQEEAWVWDCPARED